MELIVTLTTAFLNIVLGLFTFFKNPKSATHRLFVVLTLIISSWAVSNYFSLHSPTPEETLFWIRVVMFITSSLGPTIFLLVLAFPGPVIPLSKKILWSIYAFTGILTATAFTPLMFSSVAIVNGNITPQPGPAILLFALSFAGGPLAAFIALFLKYRKARGLKKTQIRYFLMGIFLTFSLMVITNFLFVVMLKISYFVVFGPMFSLILVGSISYAVIRHRFLDIKMVVARSVAYTLVLTLITSVYALGFFFIGKLVFGNALVLEEMLFSAAIAVVVTLTFQPVRRFIERITEQLFYRQSYDTAELLQELSHSMAASILLSEVIEIVLNQLQACLKPVTIGVILKEANNTTVEHSLGNPLAATDQDKNKLLELAAQAAAKPTERFFIFEEVPESPIKDLMRHYNVSIVYPLIVKNELLGGFFMGDKSSGEIFSIKDINLMRIVVPEFAVAINNALSYQEILQFNTKLEQEVQAATKELQETNARLKQLDRLKDEFVSIASHELRTPMGAIKSLITMILEEDYGKVADEIREPLQDINISVERLIHLVNNMLNISRIEAGRMKFVLSSFSLNDLLNRVVSTVHPLAMEKKINLVLEEIPSLVVSADQEKVEQIILNLVGNAIKFTNDAGTISLYSKVRNDVVQVYVHDTGMGISKEDRQKLFGKFQQVTSQEKGKPIGSGLGLYISRELARKMGGELWIEDSVIGKGSTFGFSIPLAKSATAQAVIENFAAEIDKE